MKSTYLLLFILIVLVGCKPKEDEYYSHVEPENPSQSTGNELYNLPDEYAGLIQSPINILTTQLEEEKDHQIKVVNPHCHATNIVNTGHTVQINFEPGTIIQFEGGDFEFQQVHFHTPSEHHIDGITYPMEFHFVSHYKDAVDSSSHYLVIATLFKMGRSNNFIKEFIDLIPENPSKTTNLEDKSIFLDDLERPSHIDEYDWFHYDGSLTTNPYTETANWLVLKDILEASPEEIYKINALEGNNARHIQALYDRKVEE